MDAVTTVTGLLLSSRERGEEAGLAKSPDRRLSGVGGVERALDVEERNKNLQWLGWKWHDVRAYPAQIVRLVVDAEAGTTSRFTPRKRRKEISWGWLLPAT
jgi:hypothetical protein